MSERIRGTRRSLVRSWWARIAARIVKLRSDVAIAVLDMVLVSSAFTAMLLLRFDGNVSKGSLEGMLGFLPLAAIVFVLCNGAWGLYGQLWRHACL